MSITIQKKSSVVGTVQHLPSSKSISNRALVINALTANQSVVSNLSTARDTRLMQSLIGSDERIIDVKDAGTTMRFLTAYFALTGKNKVLTGTDRMKQRPIGVLVSALRELGAEVAYLGKEGFPPIETQGFVRQKASGVALPGNVSSQYISALMMMGPVLPKGLTLHIEGPIGSQPYIDMTADLMKSFGVNCDFSGRSIHIPAGEYRPARVAVEADWSAASYWFAFVALAAEAEVVLPNVFPESLQGDRVAVQIMEKLGVKSVFENGTARLQKQTHLQAVQWDFRDCPDLAQTVIPVCAAKGITGSFTGMESLRIKETDRIAALQTELSRIGARLFEEKTGVWVVTPGQVTGPVRIDTYHDHRMAMGLAPWATLAELTVDDPTVVDKSYPGYWDDLRAMGFEIS